MISLGLQILAKSWFQFIAICLVARDCSQGEVKKQALDFITSPKGNQMEIGLMRYAILEILLRLFQDFGGQIHTKLRPFTDSIFVAIGRNILLMVTVAELFYYAFELDQVQDQVAAIPSDIHVVPDTKKQLVSFAIFLPGLAMAILIRVIIRISFSGIELFFAKYRPIEHVE